MSDVIIRRALLSVSDKTGLAELGKALAAMGVELVSTGGTARALREAGLEVRDVADLTGFPEMMDGRVKTLHPMVHGGLLAVRDDPAHAAAMEAHGIGAIDLVVVNLYPFAQTVTRGAERDEVIENIDIGGPSMVRSAAKNHRYVAIVTDPADYAIVAKGTTTLEERKLFAAKAFALTAQYDATASRSRCGAGRSCAMVRTRTRRRRSICPPARRRAASVRPSRFRARSSATTISTMPMLRSNWWRSSGVPSRRS
jgi:phosphoribosylaminoimidazolecarboxamide formyltransferase / IMP cyclohydrolase